MRKQDQKWQEFPSNGLYLNRRESIRLLYEVIQI